MSKTILILCLLSMPLYARNFFSASYVYSLKEMELNAMNVDSISGKISPSGYSLELETQTQKFFSLGLKFLSVGGSVSQSGNSTARPGETLSDATIRATVVGPVLNLVGEFDPIRLSIGIWPAYGHYNKSLTYGDGASVIQNNDIFMLGQQISIGMDFNRFLLSLVFSQYSSIASKPIDLKESSPIALEFKLTTAWGGAARASK